MSNKHLPGYFPLIVLLALHACTDPPKDKADFIDETIQEDGYSAQTSLVQIKAQIDSLQSLDEEDYLAARLKEVNESEYSNFTFNITLPSPSIDYRCETLLAEDAEVFATAKVDSNDKTKPIDRLPRYTMVKVIERSNRLCLIEYGNSGTGYILAHTLCEFHFTEPALDAEFFIWTSETGTNGKKEVTIGARSLSSQELITEITVPFRVHSYSVSRRTSALKNAQYLVCLNFYRESCPGHEEECLYAFHNGRFKEVTTSFGMGEYGWYSFNTPYLPVRFENNLILHLPNADLQNPVNWRDGTLRVYEVPDSIEIPLSELVVVHSKQAEMQVDEHYEAVLDDRGKEVMQVNGEAFHFYRWDGEFFTRIASTNPDYFAQ